MRTAILAVVCAALLAACSGGDDSPAPRGGEYVREAPAAGYGHSGDTQEMAITRIALKVTWDSYPAEDRAYLCDFWYSAPTLTIDHMREALDESTMTPRQMEEVLTDFFDTECGR